ncbi:MFS transporter [Bradyrhizobium sp. U87765 SZCCT0131]|uniref:MFS transporter n=1 Tax=unclassified Bradyrhizobium TaxID=2631580 RepID=UPI001BA6ED60|nr:MULTISPECIES: MFS transporter [unclassified Bradyrhizobium]MBR1219283.1 MFS transporter [Bradyrhizobium sp. U87765 SZCCT0131]MBR1261934.1 MFS transporter [Bradyrhizobium sp. U87765 SZCCT0134]MBR1306213.1 MFS transporter [Bradyrhizobium sp. U87765 SZCCT0110]MBR1317716.1 MFS transporter [Bradyrhizobium sp. U87765 SZCCT0109]MBR1351418.1 MFS transporter [Bradyrhizobium sp. U87765 SZCCT0048]
MLAVLFIARTAMALQFQTVGSSAPLLVGGLGFSYADIGTLIGLYLLPGVFIALPGGLLGQRFGINVVLGGLVLMVVGGVITAVGTSFAMLAFGRLVSGVGAVLLNVLLTKLVADWFVDRSVTTALALLVTSWPLGIGAGLAGGHVIATAFGWPVLMYAAAAFALASLLLVVAVYRAPPQAETAPAATLRPRLNGYELTMALISGAIWAVYNVGFIVLISFAPEFFAARGYSLGQASGLVSLLGWFLVPMIVVGGVLTARTGRPNLLMAGGFIIAAITAAALPVATLPALLFVIIAIAAGLPAGPIMTLPVEVLRPENRAVGMGIFFSCYYGGMAVLPAFAGSLRDFSGTTTAPVLFAAAMMLVGLSLLVIFRNLQRADGATAAPSVLAERMKG